jgi:single-strand DNA-binding protein
MVVRGAHVVSGQLQTRKWQDQNGQDRYTTEVVLPPYRGEIVLLGAADRDGQPVADQSDYGESPGPPKELDDDIPF